MTDEVIAPAAENQTATSEEQTVATTAPETESAQQESTTQAEEPKSKTFSQEELDRIVQKEKAKAEARAERRALKVYAEKLEAMNQKPVEKQEQPKAEGKPTIEQYGDDVDGYIEAKVKWQLQQARQQEEVKAATQTAKQREAVLIEKVDKIFSKADKIAGFDREAFHELPLSDASTFAIVDSDIPEKIMLHLTQNPDEAERIYKLSPARQAAEIGKMEAMLLSAKPTKVSSAPAPIKPVGSRGGMSAKAPSDMNLEELRAYEKTRGARYA